MMGPSGLINEGGRGFEGRCLHRKKRRRGNGYCGDGDSQDSTTHGPPPMGAAATPPFHERASVSMHPPLISFRRLSLFHSLYLFAILLLSLPTTQAAATTCLRFADYDSINALLTDGGPGTVIQLCPSKIYRLSGPIIFTAAEQEITTFGQPADNTRAVLRVQGNGETAVQGDCRRCKGVKIRNLIIDGYRPKLGRSKPTELAGPLVVLGGNEGQVVQDCILRNPRGFTAIHVREGDKLECKGASIIGNTIGPVGEEYDPKKDGEDPELSPLGKPLADGVSIACRDSQVKDNIFFDNTAASIVLYCSPGTIVENNTITSEKTSAMAGILMVDATPFEADYTGVIVQRNTISAKGAGMRVGIGIGPTVWSDDTETILTGGSVIQNKLEGAHMGYGIAAAGLKGWTILDNVNEASYEGQRGDRCFPEMTNPDPMPFLYTSGTITDSQVQEEFVNADFQYDPVNVPSTKAGKAEAVVPKEEKVKAPPVKAKPVVAAKKEKVKKLPYTKPKVYPNLDDHQFRGEVNPSKSAQHPEFDTFDTGSTMMDGILEHSRARVIEEIDRLNQRVEGLFGIPVDGGGKDVGEKGGKQEVQKTGMGGVIGLQKRVEALERDQGKLVEQATGLRGGMQKWNQEIAKTHAWEHELLLDIQSRLHHHFSTHPSDHVEISPGEHHDDHTGHEANQAILSVSHDQAGKESKERLNLRQRSERARLLAAANGDGGWMGWIVVLVIIGMGLAGYRSWRNRATRPTVRLGPIQGVGGPGTGIGPQRLGYGSSREMGGAIGRGGQGIAWRPWLWKDGHRKVT